MPTDNPSEPLEWNEENLAQVLAGLYQEAETDESLHRRLLASPFEVLSDRIAVPEEYRGGVFVREKGKKVMMLYPPTVGTVREAMPEGTTHAEQQPDFEPICTTTTVW